MSADRRAKPEHVRALEEVLRRQIDAHEALRCAIEKKRQAIRSADLTTIAEQCRSEQAILARLERLEAGRRQISAALAGDLGLTDPPLSALCALLEEPQRSLLLAQSVRLRELAVNATRESSIVRTAAEALNRHLSGLMQSVRATLSRAGIYGRRGTVADPAQLHCSLDVRS